MGSNGWHMTPCPGSQVRNSICSAQEDSGEQGPQTSATKITDPRGNTSLLVKGGNEVLEYSSCLNWQSWSQSTMGLGWWVGVSAKPH